MLLSDITNNSYSLSFYFPSCFYHQDLSSWSSADELDTSGSLSPVSGRSTPSRRRSVTLSRTCTCYSMRARCLVTPARTHKVTCAPNAPTEDQIHPCHPKISPLTFLHLHNPLYSPSFWIQNSCPAFYSSSCMFPRETWKSFLSNFISPFLRRPFQFCPSCLFFSSSLSKLRLPSNFFLL